MSPAKAALLEPMASVSEKARGCEIPAVLSFPSLAAMDKGLELKAKELRIPRKLIYRSCP